MFVLHWSFLPLSFLFSQLLLFLLSTYLVFVSFIFMCLPLPSIWAYPTSFPAASSFSLPPSLSRCCLDLKDIQNNKHRYLIASENQRPGHFSTAPIGSLTASPSSGALCSQGGLQSVTSIQERIMSTPGGEEAIERLKVKKMLWDERCWNHTHKNPELSGGELWEQQQAPEVDKFLLQEMYFKAYDWSEIHTKLKNLLFNESTLNLAPHSLK